MISNLPGMVYRARFNDRWRMAFASEGCAELTGFPPSHFTRYRGSHYELMAHPKDRKKVLQELKNALDNKAAFELLYRIETRDGDEKWVLEHGVGVFDRDDNLLGTEGVISDITDKQ